MNNSTVISHLLRARAGKILQVVPTAESISHSKPNPEIFLERSAETWSGAERCAVVEDSIFGVKAAKAANMGCVAVTTGVYSRRA